MDDVTSNIKQIMEDLLITLSERKFYYEISSVLDSAYIYIYDDEITIDEINKVNEIVKKNKMYVDYILFTIDKCGAIRINFAIVLDDNF